MKKSNNPEGRPVVRSLERSKLPCTMCGKTRAATKFKIVGPLKNRRHSWCEQCTKKHQQEMYQNRVARGK